MRWIGVLCVILLSAVVAQAAVVGKVNSIGFGSFIRPDCWIPLTIQTTSDESGPKSFDLQVVQTDLDGDQVVYTRPVTVNPGVQQFWTCFKPDPVNGGIPASGTPISSDLSKRLKIFLFDPSTNRQVVQIATAGNLPQAAEVGQYAGNRGQKLILVVGRSPKFSEYQLSGRDILGTLEDVLFVRVRAEDLPADALGYEAADGIVWTDEDPERLAPDQFRAMRQYVRSGGRLVVIQNNETQRMGRLDDFLPVHVEASQVMPGVNPLSSLTRLPEADASVYVPNPWRGVNGPFNIVRATPITDAVVDTWATWPDGSRTPYIARRLFGVGCVSWIAQDISDPAATAVSAGWPKLWERLMDWHNNDHDTLVFTSLYGKRKLEDKAATYDSSYSKDIGQSFNKSINQINTTAGYITIAVIFFIGYWLVAGPGNYFVLAARKQTQWSWFIFAVIAVAATLLTVGVTRAVLRGTARVQHLSLVRVSADGAEPAYVQSQFSVYIPRDEVADIALTDRDKTAFPAAITPLVSWPEYNNDNVAVRGNSKYAIPIEGEDQGQSVQINVPFRSTLKKLQATWAGQPLGRITGRPTLLDGNNPLSGMLSNNTGQTLKNVVMVFRWPNLNGVTYDHFLAFPEWKDGVTIDLGKEWDKASSKPAASDAGPAISLAFLDGPQRGRWEWAATWIFNEFRGGMDRAFDDSNRDFPRSFPLASFFDRCIPMVNDSNAKNRNEIFRHDVRNWDCSAAVAGGAMVIIGQADSAIPLPLSVDGETPQSTGRTLYQCIVPMDQSHFSKPPSTQPVAP